MDRHECEAVLFIEISLYQSWLSMMQGKVQDLLRYVMWWGKG